MGCQSRKPTRLLNLGACADEVEKWRVVAIWHRKKVVYKAIRSYADWVIQAGQESGDGSGPEARGRAGGQGTSRDAGVAGEESAETCGEVKGRIAGGVWPSFQNRRRSSGSTWESKIRPKNFRDSATQALVGQLSESRVFRQCAPADRPVSGCQVIRPRCRPREPHLRFGDEASWIRYPLEGNRIWRL